MLRLPFRNQTWKGAAGAFSGSGTGTSMDFMDQRVYTPGDDPRYINWQAFARTGNYTMKLYREEIRPVIDLLVDVSESMLFNEEKKNRTTELVRFLIDSSSASGAAIHMTAVNADATRPIHPLAIHSQDWLSEAQALKPQKPEAMPAFSQISLRANSLRVLISDLLFTGDPNHAFQALTHQHGRLIIFSPFIQAEATPNWSGNYDFINPEDRSLHRHRIEPATLRRYKASYQKHFALWKNSAIRHQAPLAHIPSTGDLLSTLYQYALPIGAVETIS